MKIIKYTLTLMLVSIVLVSCEKSFWLEDGDYFHIENKGAVMPVWVTGNLESGIYILVNHGGPGYTSGHEFSISKGFKDLEKDYALIYWDQRMSGMSQGDPQKEDLTIEQHVEDLKKLVELIRSKYNPETLFLMGHSWGGVLSGTYLGEGNHQDYFNGWIDMDGSLEDSIEGQARKEWILERVGPVLEQSDDKALWQYIIDWYEENPNPVESDPEPYWYANNLGAYVYDWDYTQKLSPVPYIDLVFSSPYAFSFYWTQYEDCAWINGYDARPQVAKITIPSLFLWGKQDGAVPPMIGELAYNTVATEPADKYLVMIDSCAHSPHYDRPDMFYNEVVEFVEKYK